MHVRSCAHACVLQVCKYVHLSGVCSRIDCYEIPRMLGIPELTRLAGRVARFSC